MTGPGITKESSGESPPRRGKSESLLLFGADWPRPHLQSAHGWKNNGNNRRRKLSGKAGGNTMNWVSASDFEAITGRKMAAEHPNSDKWSASDSNCKSRAEERSSCYLLIPDAHKGSPCLCRACLPIRQQRPKVQAKLVISASCTSSQQNSTWEIKFWPQLCLWPLTPSTSLQ